MKQAHTVVVSLAGVGVRVSCESSAVTAAYAARFGTAEAPEARAPQCEITVRVSAGTVTPPPDVALRWEFPDADHAMASGPGFAATLDLAACTAIVDVDEAYVPKHPLFRRAALEGIPLLILNRRDRHPVHAACVRRGSAALLLHGASGVGKSTLAYTAHRAGIEVVADDATRVQLSPELRVWGEGAARSLHLLANARDEYAELRSLEPDWLSAGGVTKLTIPLPPPVAGQLPYATAARVCILSRDGGPITRRAATTAEVRETLLQAPEAVADRAPEQRARVAEALAARGGWHLKLSVGSSRVDLQACKLEYSIVSPK